MEMVIRVAVIYLTILIGLRVLGKREFAELSPLELVSLLLIPEIVSDAISHEDPSLTNAIVGIATLFSLVFMTSVAMYRSKRMEEIIDSVPVVLVQDGAFVAENMQKERVTPDEIGTELRKAGLERLDQVKWAVLETDGKISIVAEESAGKTHSSSSDERAIT